MAALAAELGRPALRERLIARFFELGEAGAAAARACYAAHGLDEQRRGALGLALQQLLAWADGLARLRDWPSAAAAVCIHGRTCDFAITTPEPHARASAY
jgi:hypothetical protein